MSELKRSLTQDDRWDPACSLTLLRRQLLRDELGSPTCQADQALDRQEAGAGQLPATGWVQGAHTHWEAAGKDFPLPRGTNTVDKTSMKR